MCTGPVAEYPWLNPALYPFERHYLEWDGSRYHYLDEGEGHPVVMVHGNPTWSFYYRELVKALRSTHRTIAPDHIGCGLSSKPQEPAYRYRLDQRITDLGRLIDHLELEDLTMIVHDWGGAIGLGWAGQNADRIRRLVVLNTAAFFLPEGKSFPASLALARAPGLGGLLVRGLNGFVRTAEVRCVTRKPLSPDVAAAYRGPYNSWANRIAVHRFVEDIPLRPEDPSYAALDQTAKGLEGLRHIPMLICWGMKDFVFDHVFLDEWIRRFPDAEVHRFEDAGHYVLEDATQEIVPLVQRFLGSGAGHDPTP